MPTKSASRRSRRKEKPVPSSNDWDRRHMPSMQLHESEKLLLGVLIVLLVLQSWALGSTHLLAQAAACFFALVALGAALLPRHGNTHSITSWGQCKRLLGFPVFWFGSLLLVFVAVQGFNTAWTVEGTEGFRVLTASEHLGWLPSGVSGGPDNAFHWLLIFGTPFLTACAIWIGITRRRSVLILLTALAINSIFLAGIGFYQIVKNKVAILWFYEPPTQTFLGTFPYHWQGAAYLTLILAAVAGVAAHYYAQARRTFKRSNPSGLFVFVGLVLTLSALFSKSHIAAAVACGLAAAFLVHIGYRELTVDSPLGRKLLLALVGVVVIGVAAQIGGNTAANIARGERIPAEESAIATSADWSATREIGSILFGEQPIFGWGAGSFSSVYQEIGRKNEVEAVPESLAKEYAGSDWFRFPAELGIVGTLLLLLMPAYLLKQYFDRRTLENPLIAFLLLGSACGLVLGFSSFVFENVAFITVWSLLLTLGAGLIRIERSVRSRTEDA